MLHRPYRFGNDQRIFTYMYIIYIYYVYYNIGPDALYSKQRAVSLRSAAVGVVNMANELSTCVVT